MAKLKDQPLIIPIHSTIAVLAPPSCGKGRFCRELGKLTKVLHVETGQLLRQTDNPDITAVMADGGNVDSSTVVKLIKGHVGASFDRHSHHFMLLDSLPRELDQCDMLMDVAIGHIQILQLKVDDATVRRRFLASLESDPDRKGRPDNTVHAFDRRLREFRQKEPRILEKLRRMGFPIFKREISNTDHAVTEFHRIHIAGRRNLRPEGAHLRHH